MYVRRMNGSLLVFWPNREAAMKWIHENGYEVQYSSGRSIYVDDSKAWFTK